MCHRHGHITSKAHPHADPICASWTFSWLPTKQEPAASCYSPMPLQPQTKACLPAAFPCPGSVAAAARRAEHAERAHSELLAELEKQERGGKKQVGGGQMLPCFPARWSGLVFAQLRCCRIPACSGERVLASLHYPLQHHASLPCSIASIPSMLSSMWLHCCAGRWSGQQRAEEGGGRAAAAAAAAAAGGGGSRLEC